VCVCVGIWEYIYGHMFTCMNIFICTYIHMLPCYDDDGSPIIRKQAHLVEFFKIQPTIQFAL